MDSAEVTNQVRCAASLALSIWPLIAAVVALTLVRTAQYAGLWFPSAR